MARDDGNGSTAGVVSDAVGELERELRAQGARRWVRRLIVVAAIAGALVGVRAWREANQPPPPPKYSVEKVETRDIVEEVQSTGRVRPVTEVQVGAQVSGRVVRVHADFNSAVKKGDLLAEIDPSLFGAQVTQASAQLRAAQAQQKRAEATLATATLNVKRMERLHREGLASQADLDQAQGSRDVAEADVGAARAQIAQIRAALSSAQTTLAYARIYSPIDGVVVNRAIEPGQTVAASFSAPVLFVIAQDLSKMQVLAEVDEADVGHLAEKLPADVVVDAFPGKKFVGVVSQLRYSPNIVQGVVTYSAVIDVDNPRLELRPGMTATVTVRTREARGTTAVRNGALRFRPLPKKDEEGKPIAEKPPAPLAPGQGRVFALVDATPGAERVEERVVETGVTDGVWTALSGAALPVGLEVVTEEREDKRKKRFGVF
ncbi:MAG: efflux RND transporter periplasmic adaptor subunit [Polyangiaceae bacterium]|nr:efflux RND transporter periplasmic adaptor subunit [Polyangiaceae bacterium]